MSAWPPGFQSRTTDPDSLKRAAKERKQVEQRKAGRNVGGPTYWRPQRREWMGEQK